MRSRPSPGFDALESGTITPAQDAALDAYYSDVFVKGLDVNTGNVSDPQGFIPTSPAEKYLQAHYTAPFTNFDEAIKLDDAGDGSAWSAAHATYHDYFREPVERFHYEDALLLDTDGNVVYSAFSGADLGTNVEAGPHRTPIWRTPTRTPCPPMRLILSRSPTSSVTNPRTGCQRPGPSRPSATTEWSAGS